MFSLSLFGEVIRVIHLSTLTSSMSSPNQTSILLLNSATIQMNRFAPMLIYLFGTIGNILNILVLSQRTFRSNSCAFLFLGSSIASLIALLAGLTNRIIFGWTMDLSNSVDWICQCRAFILFVSRMMALWLITLATIDRWLLSSTNVHRRQMSKLTNARRGTLLVLLLASLFNGPIIYCYQANLIGTPQRCYGKTSLCRLYTDMLYAVGSILIPSMLMLLFSVLIIRNVRHTRQRIDMLTITKPIVHHSTHRTKKKDRQLLIMLLIQVLCIVLLTFPQAIQKLYATFTLKNNASSKSDLQTAIETFLFDAAILLTYSASGLPFYIYTLSGGRVFRDGCRQFLQTISQTILCCKT